MKNKRYIMKGRFRVSLMLMVIFSASVISLSANPPQTDGEYGWKLLVIPPNTSTSAMAGTGASISSEADAFIMHPTAGLLNNQRSLSVSQNSWLFKTNINSVAINLPNGSRSLGFALRTLDYGKFYARDIRGDIIGEFHPLDVNLLANMAFRVSPNYYAGINFFLLYQKIDSASSLGFAGDIGMTYLTPLQGMKIHAAVKHIGATTEVIDERIKLPVTPELSIGYALPASLERVYAEMKLLLHPDDDDLKMVMGTNIAVTSAFDIRFGYRLNYDSHNWSAGLGMNLRDITFNYSYLPFEFDGNDAHSFGLTYRF